MSSAKERSILEYKEECFKQTLPYAYEMTYLPEGSDDIKNTIQEGSYCFLMTVIMF
ncbi:MAG: hypothetical protein IKE35_00010 [Lachnospiraceae bacterium]|nr:hypothetical protein [Lachnospiraceae bacterium]